MQILHTLKAYFNALMNFKNFKNVVLGFNITIGTKSQFKIFHVPLPLSIMYPK